MTHDRGFHINPKNFKNLLSCFQNNMARLIDEKPLGINNVIQ